MAAPNQTDKIAAQAIPGGAPSFNSPEATKGITPNRAMKFGELKPRIPKPRAISSKPPHAIQAVGPQRHYKPRGSY